MLRLVQVKEPVVKNEMLRTQELKKNQKKKTQQHQHQQQKHRLTVVFLLEQHRRKQTQTDIIKASIN